MTGLLFRFFHREVLKTVNFADGEEEEDEEVTEEANMAGDCDPAIMALAALGLKGLSLN